MSVFSRDNWFSYLLIAIVFIMGIEIVYLIRQNSRLRDMIANPRQYVQPLSQEDTVPAFTARDIDGDTVSVSYSRTQPHTMLLWFSPTCEACEENFSFWNELDRDYASESLRLFGMSTADPVDLRRVVDERGLSFLILSIDNPSIVDAYRGNVLPQTVLVSPDGSIRAVWPGPLQQGHKESIIACLAEIGTLTRKGGDGQ